MSHFGFVHTSFPGSLCIDRVPSTAVTPWLCTCIHQFLDHCALIQVLSAAVTPEFVHTFFFFLNTHLSCLAGCLSMIVWTHAVLGVLYACFVFLYLHLFSTIEHVSHGKAPQKFTHHYDYYYHYYYTSLPGSLCTDMGSQCCYHTLA